MINDEHINANLCKYKVKKNHDHDISLLQTDKRVRCPCDWVYELVYMYTCIYNKLVALNDHALTTIPLTAITVWSVNTHACIVLISSHI